MKRTAFAIVLLGLWCCFGRPGAFADNQPAVDQATRAAQSWLELVDSGRYRRSYQESASYFKSRVAEQKWVDKVEPVRKPLGAVISRKLDGTQYTTALPGVPDGQYVVMRFDTSFKNKKSAVETVTAMLDKDGKWRITGYFIR